MPVINLEEERLFLKDDPEKGPRQVVGARRFGDREGKIVLSVLSKKSGVVYNARLEYLLLRNEIGEIQAALITRFVDQELEAGESPPTSAMRCAL